MSETTKTAETARKGTDHVARSSHASIDAAGKATKDSINETGHIAQNAADRARDMGQSITDTVAETANAATSLSSKAAEQSREAMLMGVRTAAGVGGRVADISFGRGHHLLASATQAMDIYRDASERSSGQVQALFSSYMTFGRGLQHLQHAWLEMVDHTLENASHKPQDLLRCKNLVELAEVQRDLYIDAMNHAFESTSRLFDIGGQIAQQAARPLQSHHR